MPSPHETTVRAPRWRFIVPNAITCASLVLGLASIGVSFLSQDFVLASWLIILSVLLDKLDGSVARLLKATSDIGVQLDSFADFVTFGIAPGAMLFAMGGQNHIILEGSLWGGEGGLILLSVLCAVYILCTCIRLAKFNVLAESNNPIARGVFYGMPSTFAGGLLAIALILLAKYEQPVARDALPVLAAVLGILMVSNAPLPKPSLHANPVFKALQVITVVLTYIFGFARLFPEYLLFNVFAYGSIGFTWGFLNRKRLLAARRLDPYPDEAPPL